MKVIYAIIILIICIVLLAFISADFRLSLTRFWGLATVSNNPLLPSLDSDFKSLTDSHVDEGRIDVELLFSGGPPKDGIPAVDNPKFSPIDESIYSDEELIIGVTVDGVSKAYPYSILNWHEVVNDEIAGLPITISYCPLCETNSVYIRRIDGVETTFGVSGKLWNSCLVMYDRLTDSLWVQPWGIAVFGDSVNKSLETIPGIRTTLGAWREKYPDSLVMNTDTGFNRDYTRYPYGSYYTNDDIIFPVREEETNYHPKDIQFVYYSASDTFTFDRFDGDAFRVTLNDLRDKGEVTFDNGVVAKYDADLDTAIFYKDGVEVPAMAIFGFVFLPFFG